MKSIHIKIVSVEFSIKSKWIKIKVSYKVSSSSEIKPCVILPSKEIFFVIISEIDWSWEKPFIVKSSLVIIHTI